MLRLLRRIFPPREVRALIDALSTERSAIQSQSGSALAASSGMDLLLPELTQAIYAAGEAVASKIATGNESPRVLVLLLISNVAHNRLRTGREHTYRGVLSMRGQGIKSLWEYAVSQLVEAGSLTLTDAHTARARLDTELAEVG